jgi:hypothetical protein
MLAVSDELHDAEADARLCLVKLGVLTKDDYSFLVLGVFWK